MEKDIDRSVEIAIPEGCDLNEDITLEKLRIDPTVDLTEPPVFCTFGGIPVMTAGNITLIDGKAKSAKTFLLGAIVASFTTNSTQLGVITSYLPENKRTILYFDTEQSRYHAERSIKRICELTGEANPPNLISYALRPMGPTDRINAIEKKIARTQNLGVVVIDGIRDLLPNGINDETSTTTMSSKLLKWTYDYDIHIILILHQNKGDRNPRGHIGTELMHKAESTITIEKGKNPGYFTVSSSLSRDIPFDDFAFRISEGLPVKVSLPEKLQKKVRNKFETISDEEHISWLKELYAERKQLRRIELMKCISDKFGVGDTNSRKFFAYYKAQGWITDVKEGRYVYFVLQMDASNVC